MKEAMLVRIRLALFAVSLVTVALQLTLMRGLALRFWSHFACMVISVGLLGFGASGTLLTVLERKGWVTRNRPFWLCGLALGSAVSIPIAWWASQVVPLDVGFLAWSFSQAGNVLLIELALVVPFLMVGGMVGVALMDAPDRIGGHYAANLLGSGAGGLAAVLGMHLMGTVQLLAVLSTLALGAGLLLLDWTRRLSAAAVALAATLILGLTMAWMPWEPAVSEYKFLALARQWQGTQTIHRAEGPLGRIDVLAGPKLHYAPGLSLQYMKLPPRHVLMVLDGDGVSPVYDCPTVDDWIFLDYRTAAAAFHLPATRAAPPSVCVIGAGGGAEIGLALYHRSGSVTALEMNGQIIDTMTGPLAQRGGAIYTAPPVRVLNQESRGFFSGNRDKFNVIQLPAIDGFGASGAGLYAAQESYLYTVESFQEMYGHLAPGGVLSVTRWAQVPPRTELRAFDIAVQVLQRLGKDPALHLVMIRSWVTSTILLFESPIAPADTAAIREFCDHRGFDLCYMPGMFDGETNRFHQVDHPHYVAGPRALLAGGTARQAFLEEYPFEIAASTDDQPYFFHGFKWSALATLKEQMGAGSRSFLEVGYLMLVAALIQTLALGVLLVLAPLLPGIGGLRKAPGKGACLTYFLMLGLGFMLLEMGFVQKLVLYLAHPIYAAAVVIGSFMVFAGLGSHCSRLWRFSARRVIILAVITVALFALGFLLALDGWLHLTQSWGVAARCAVAAVTIGPLAFAMGHMFPLGLQRAAQTGVQGDNPAGNVGGSVLVAWSWAVNGFASVAATAATPLLAMRLGFSWLVIAAVVCYLLAALAFGRIGGASPRTAAPARTPLSCANG